MGKIVTVKQDDEVLLEFEVTNAMLTIARKLAIPDNEYILAVAMDKLKEKEEDEK
jgi:hypothetical protein